ncbi:bifunctional DNA-formamidopyrimidine glycosylase/DNA-(apurinic or apyrimidinic site) lyase [Testudinibacter sp. TR-2022]|uniref:bifunctional DNA-formamidopyrimidine glycosylase/DNA-(apurinic or apyrimidinic site) lyase n=1 Tax=Testudinibacter sp. TR-2022 TaxID=2585029 RepID=UPI0011199AFD|nr:bifunctional DNA-formamidopyrimidine glycosylase/DNA-(apurinic or apyrimidinic site) lyase [Testudinibacter sp. TR-2022]TNH07028.1 bifunctional DNA-formamidopyrimidine glycosylase/DNA-(apurinic or apyrimidinic site) lyase [Pasteurellaceae bacterium Phil11]TNH21769.1 bifunctional DNA-formamidopyrimidine glycosylase/DNA-(apurinic or apyrimidinic site) lyase [Testudinibacter sp. TR-2022]TNH29082.1 bifunctional DNA-formamidopyrimidine glycosylase/DNA-(apurinic or apyrimidinic site) lyase [Testudi
MPELPEVETTLRGIAPFVLGQQIEQIRVHRSKLRWEVSPELSEFYNVRITGLQRRAKYLILETEQGYIVGHLGMSGSLRIVDIDDESAVQDKHDHLEFIFTNGKILRYNDPRRFGAWLWTETLADFPLFAKLGPEPLSEEFNADYFWQKSRNKNTPVKSFVMNNAVVVGVGNIYANETLFLCGIHPLTPPSQLTRTQCYKLVEQVKQVLKDAIRQGGTSLKDFVQPDGRPGYFAQQLYVYGKVGEPCPTCGTKIESAVIGQRNSFYCPRCQVA